ncbi:MAG: hypothetical protein JO199_07695 [Candidatus Eremiobacteraeota bacterium]|nr:hypothetical protein [Candidatus Eremiobacteraeota bacterium]
MPASGDPQADRVAVEREVEELERLCGELERSLVSGDWTSAANALRDSRRVTHAFLNAMDAVREWHDESFEKAVYGRVRRVFDVRQDQLERLMAFRDDVVGRLAEVSRWKAFARSTKSKSAAPRATVGLDRIS